MYQDIPHLNIRNLENGNLRLENEDCGESYVVDVHPTQVRLMAEYLGLVREVSACDADELRTTPTPAELTREVARLQRYLLAVQDKALQLHEYTSNCSDWKHADLTGEMLRVVGIVDMLDLACGDFQTTPESEGLNTTEIGVVERPQKRVPSSPEQMTIEGAGDER